MACSCKAHFDSHLLNHIRTRRNAQAKSMLTQQLARAHDCRGTLLHRAAEADNVEITRHLIDMGSAVDHVGIDGKTALTIAVAGDCKTIVRILLNAGASIDIAGADGESALEKALCSTDIDFKVVEAVLLKLRTETPATEDLVERLLKAGCTFPHAALVRDVDVLKELLQRGFDVNSRNHEKRTALHFAALIKELEAVKLLVDCGADVNALDYCNCSPLYYAANRLDPIMMRFLLEHGADSVPDFGYSGQCSLFVSIFIGDSDDDDRSRECAELLLERGVFPPDPRSFVKELQYSYDGLLESSRLNCLTAHQAMLDALGIASCIKEEHLTTFVQLKKYYDECRKMLDVVVVGTTSLLGLVAGYSEYQMRLRARRDETFVQQVKEFCSNQELKKRFSYYHGAALQRIAKAARSVELENKAIPIICELFHCDYNQFNIFARQVVGYLSERDLEQLCSL